MQLVKEHVDVVSPCTFFNFLQSSKKLQFNINVSQN